MRLGGYLPIFLDMVEEITRGINKVQDLASSVSHYKFKKM